MISKAVLPVAGLGTRFLPATKAIPKEMIPVVDKPLIQYVVEEAVAAGIREIVLVTHSSKKAIEDHFDKNYELETELARRQKQALLAEVQAILPAGVSVIAVRQAEALGLGHAVLCAKPVVGNAPFAVLLPDVLVDNFGQAQVDLKRMVEAYQERHASQIMVEAVPEERVDQYGIVDCGGVELQAGQSVAMQGIVEKPARAAAPSNLSVVGRYVLPGRIFELLEQTPPGAGNEIQLTDAIAALMQEAPVEAYKMAGQTFDCGSKLGYLQATLTYGRRHPQIGAAFSDYLQQLTDH